MKDKQKRPVNLDLTTMVFPPMAIASILHRISGIMLFLCLPAVLYWLDLSLRDVTTFTDLQLALANPYAKTVLWVFAASAWYHLLAGIRHMLMDVGIGESLHVGRVTAMWVIGLGVVGALMLGVWIW